MQPDQPRAPRGAPLDVHANVIVPCRDTREDLDGALCTGEFRYGPRDIQAKCTVCGGWRGRYAPGLVADGAEDAYQRGLAEGRRQATEGWEHEWGTQWATDSSVGTYPCDDEAEARQHIERYPGNLVVSRLVGPWETAEQPEPAGKPEDGER